MLVHELIKELQELPPFVEVLIDATPVGSKLWKFKEVNTVGEVEMEADKYIVLASVPEDEKVENNN